MDAGKKKYNVLLCGVQTGNNIESVARKLSESTKIPSPKFETMLLKKSVIIKPQVDLETAEKIRKTIMGCGARCSILPVVERTGRVSPNPESKSHRLKGKVKHSTGSVGRLQKKSKRWSVFRCISIVGLLVLCLYGYFLFLQHRTVAKFDASLKEYDSKGSSLATPEETIETLGRLLQLYNHSVEITPFFTWSSFNPDKPPLRGIYSLDDINDITDELSNRGSALLKKMKEVAGDEQSLHGISLHSVSENLHAFELCVIRKLMRRTRDNVRIEASLHKLAVMAGDAVDCGEFPIQPLSTDGIAEIPHPYQESPVDAREQLLQKMSYSLLEARCKNGNRDTCIKLSIVLAEDMASPGKEGRVARQHLTELCTKGIQPACEVLHNN